MRDPTPAELVVELLTTLEEALYDTASWTDGTGVRMMPGTYSLHSYPELEARMREMRDGDMRPQWWHVSSRYLWGKMTWLRVPYRRTVKGNMPLLPGRTEELIQGPITRLELPGGVEHTMWVKCYVWGAEVNPLAVSEGVDYLVTHMYEGDTTKLSLPDPFLWRMLGIDRGESNGRSPGKGNVSRAPLVAP